MTASHHATSYLAKLIAAESTPGRERAIIELACQEMQSLGYRDVHVDGAGNAVGLIGSGFPTVLVDCHVDTIPLHAAEVWTHDPFGAEVSHGRMYGLGACDMKASVAAATHGLIELQTLPPGSGTVVLVCSVAEEMMEGAALIEAVQAARPDLVVIGEPTDLAVNRGQRGRAKLDLAVHGHGAHAANRADAANAVEAMAAILAELAAGQRTNPDPELAFSTLEISSEPNPSISMIPHRCVARLDVRFGPTVAPDRILTELDAVVARAVIPGNHAVEREWHVARFDTYTGRRFATPELVPAWDLPPDHPAVRAAVEAISRVGIDPRVSAYGFCTNGGMTAELGLPTIGFGPGRESEAHTIDEWVSLTHVERAVAGFGAIAHALLQTEPAAIVPAAQP